MSAERPRLLVIADACDRGARAVAEVVAARHGEQAVRTVAPATLTTLATWQHRIVRGRASTSVRLPDGTWLADPPAPVVLNRMRWVITPTMPSEVDRQDAVMELHALLLSWLAGLDAAVVNPPTPANLAGVGLTELDVLARLAHRGLPVRTFELTTQRRTTAAAAGDDVDPPYRRGPEPARRARVLVADRTTPGAPAGSDGVCRRVAEVLGCPLLAVELAREDPRGWVVSGVDPLPPLRVPAEVDAVADLVDRLAANAAVAAPSSSQHPVVAVPSPALSSPSPAVSQQPSGVPPAWPPPPASPPRPSSSLPPSPIPPPPPPLPPAPSTPLAPALPRSPSPAAAEPVTCRPAVWSARRAPKRRRVT